MSVPCPLGFGKEVEVFTEFALSCMDKYCVSLGRSNTFVIGIIFTVYFGNTGSENPKY